MAVPNVLGLGIVVDLILVIIKEQVCMYVCMYVRVGNVTTRPCSLIIDRFDNESLTIRKNLLRQMQIVSHP
jgi:hypothetical protein